MGLRFGALIVDKEATRQLLGIEGLPSASELHWKGSLSILEAFFQSYEVKALWCDEDIKGIESQKKFSTEVKRIHRKTWPEHPIRVRHKSSHGVGLIQLADILAYGLGNRVRGRNKTPEFSECLRMLCHDPDNIIIGPEAWRG